MNRALIIGASGGIGRAVHSALDARGVHVTALSRRTHGLDLRDEDSVADALAPVSAPYDLILVATGALQIDGQGPEKSLRQLDAVALRAQFDVNTIGPALILKHALRLMPRDQRCVFAALSARVGSIGDNRLGGWYSYRASKAALNQILHSAAIEIARSHKQAIIAALHPGTVATPFTADFVAPGKATAPEQTAANLLTVIENLTPQDSGGFFDYSGAPVPW